MARKATTMNLIIRCTVADNQLSATVDQLRIEGNVGDTTAANEYDKGPFPITLDDTWDGTVTAAAMVAACLASLKTEANIP